ncbi:phospholipase A1 member A [Daphnia magna]|uniref:phospholipase A1 member A n=1 Tax=Daphnia magna TaxID=35525 RepID=UPI001E1BA504|nr:phospholipase A1 member A [Daphnia magna]
MSAVMKTLVIVVTLLVTLSEAGSIARAEVNPVDVVFQLFTRANPTRAQLLYLNDDAVLGQSYYNHSLPTKLIAHGHYGSPTLAYSMRDAYLEKEDCNVISVDWSVLAAGEYVMVAQNGVPTAGLTTGEFVNYLIIKGTPLNAFHLIGFDMGAHAVGNAGAAVTSGKVPRITGLDPIEAYFSLEYVDARLDTNDALFVDIIHTQVTYSIPIGHVDFFPNAGLVQPGCPDPDTTCCSHCRVIDLFAESISNPTGFDSLRCSSWENYVDGSCASNNHAFMGENVNVNARGSFYLITNGQSPYSQA